MYITHSLPQQFIPISIRRERSLLCSGTVGRSLLAQAGAASDTGPDSQIEELVYCKLAMGLLNPSEVQSGDESTLTV